MLGCTRSFLIQGGQAAILPMPIGQAEFLKKQGKILAFQLLLRAVARVAQRGDQVAHLVGNAADLIEPFVQRYFVRFRRLLVGIAQVKPGILPEVHVLQGIDHAVNVGGLGHSVRIDPVGDHGQEALLAHQLL